MSWVAEMDIELDKSNYNIVQISEVWKNEEILHMLKPGHSSHRFGER